MTKMRMSQKIGKALHTETATGHLIDAYAQKEEWDRRIRQMLHRDQNLYANDPISDRDTL